MSVTMLIRYCWLSGPLWPSVVESWLFWRGYLFKGRKSIGVFIFTQLFQKHFYSNPNPNYRGLTVLCYRTQVCVVKESITTSSTLNIIWIRNDISQLYLLYSYINLPTQVKQQNVQHRPLSLLLFHSWSIWSYPNLDIRPEIDVTSRSI